MDGCRGKGEVQGQDGQGEDFFHHDRWVKFYTNIRFIFLKSRE
jgi:hypothetical protein